MMKQGLLGYNRETDRYGLLIFDLWENTGFHCGETMQVKVDGEWVDTRMEMDNNRQWYLVGTPYKGTDLEHLPVQIPV